MRLKPIPPAELSAKQRPLHDAIEAGVEKSLKGFVSKRADGALVGPFTAMVTFPQFGATQWAMVEALTKNTTLPKPAHETAILVTGARFNSRYELYAHEAVAAQGGLSEAKIATIVAGERPADLTADEAIAYDVAAVLTRGGQLPQSTYTRAVEAFGNDGVAELVFLIGNYCLVSVLLNAYDVSVPERDETQP